VIEVADMAVMAVVVFLHRRIGRKRHHRRTMPRQIVQAAGGCWVALDDKPIFPLTIGANYSDRSYPTLAVSQESVRVVFEPLLRAGLRS
jgi:hypothetical protein